MQKKKHAGGRPPKVGPHFKVVNVTLTPELHEQLESWTATTGGTTSATLRAVLEAGFHAIKSKAFEADPEIARLLNGK